MLETATRIPPKRAMLLVPRRTLKTVTFCLFLALGGFLFWHISHVVQQTFLRSHRVLEYPGELQELAMVMSNASSPTNIFSTTQSSEQLKQHKTTLITTTSCGWPYFLLVLVSSASYNAQRRRDIRLTWGVDSSLNPRWKTVFLVAQTRNRTESEALLREGKTFGDLIRADYFESYWNQTLKIQMAFEWASLYCNFSFLLKMDDDTFVDVKSLISLLAKPAILKTKLYMGQCDERNRVQRKGKWKVSFEEYNQTFYPDFCAGYGFVLSSDVVYLFVELFDVVPWFKIDDVYIGMLAEKAGVKPKYMNKFRMKEPPINTTCVNLKKPGDVLVWHGVTGKCLFDIFQATLDF